MNLFNFFNPFLWIQEWASYWMPPFDKQDNKNQDDDTNREEDNEINEDNDLLVAE